METTTTPKSAIHNRPSTTETHSKQVATARSTETQTDSICRSASKGSKPASQHKSTGTQSSNISNSTSVTRPKERRGEREVHRGYAPSKRGQSLWAAVLKPQSQSQALLDLSLKTNQQLSAVECVSLVDSSSQAKQYSYHLQPSSAGSQSGQNRTKN